jgi:hypothetical protein
MVDEQTGPARPEGMVDVHRLLTDEERGKMISIIHSMVFWVGVLVPEYEMVEGHEMELRDTVYGLTTKEHLSPEDIGKIDRLVERLRVRERELEHDLAHDPMTVDAAKSLMGEVRGLLKAIDDLRSAESEEHARVGKDEVMARVEDARRWHDFMKQVRPRP